MHRERVIYMAIKVGMVSLGCAKNQVDGEMLMANLKNAGFELCDDAALADVAIVNTCGFIDSAKQESIDEILELATLKKEGRIKKIVVTGCLAERYREEIHKELPEVDGVFGIGANADIAACIESAMNDFTESFPEKSKMPLCGERELSTPSYFAYIKIAEGCDNKCTYCAIPMIRGGYRSRPKADILAEVRKLAAQGVKEFTLIAQDTTRYGTDDGGESQLPQLIEEIAAIPGVEWLRALYCYPERVDERLLDTMKRLPNVCDYLDLPMQHISQHILTDMNRTDTSAHIREVCRMFKERGMMLRTTLMVGFPGETEEDFDELMDFVKEIKFDRMGAFMFCPEDGTRAAEMPDQIPEEVKQERYDRLMTLQHGVSLAQNKARVGTTCRVLVEKKRGSRYVGRSEYEAPETDGSIFFGSEEPCEIGSFVNVKITAAKAYDLMGERV